MSSCGLEQWTPGASPGERLRQTWQSGRCGTVQIADADVVRLTTSLARPVVTEGSGRWMGGRRWISEPTEPPNGIPVTDANTLLSAVFFAFPRWRQGRNVGADSAPSGPGGRP